MTVSSLTDQFMSILCGFFATLQVCANTIMNKDTAGVDHLCSARTVFAQT